MEKRVDRMDLNFHCLDLTSILITKQLLNKAEDEEYLLLHLTKVLCSRKRLELCRMEAECDLILIAMLIN